MAVKYKTVQETVEAIQFNFDNLKSIYLFLDYQDVTYSVKNRVISGVVTNKNGNKLTVQKNDFIVKNDKNEITIWTADEFKKKFIEVK